MGKDKFSYSTSIINSLENSISSDRLSAYLTVTSDNLEKALELYAWNTAISAELYITLQGLEVTIRNFMHRELSRIYGEYWFDNIPTIPLTINAKKKIENAKRTISNNNNIIDPPHVVAELSFGFWIALLGHGNNREYHNKLWTPALHRAFPNIKTNRKRLHKRMDNLRILRNRIAHHEPIFKRHLEADYNSIIETISWMCEDTSHWVDYHNCFSDVASGKP